MEHAQSHEWDSLLEIKYTIPIFISLNDRGESMYPSSYISSLFVPILRHLILFPISMIAQLYFWAKMVIFCIKHIGK